MKGPLIVTGCQRSGTAFVTRALAHDHGLEVLGYRDFIPEEVNMLKLETLLLHGITKIAIQMPIALNMFTDLYHTIPDVHFVGVVRDKEDIISSMMRIKWRIDDFYHYPDYMSDHVDYMMGLWELLKKILPDSCWTEVKYTDFEDHSLFVPKEQRKDFTVNQWSPDYPFGPQYYQNAEKF